LGRVPFYSPGAAMNDVPDELIVEDVLTCDVPDEELEAAAATDDPRMFTLAFCTQEWNYCYPG
jgi:hypothetical protein